MYIVCYTQERDKNFEDEFLRNRWTFFNKRVAFVHNFWFPATFISDKFWSDLRLRRSHWGDVFSILFQFIAPSLRQRKLWGRVSPQPLNFFYRKSAFVHNFWFPATFITDKFWSDSQLRRSHRGVVFSILFHFSTCSLSHRHRADGNFEDKFLRNRWTFINRKSAFVHNF